MTAFPTQATVAIMSLETFHFASDDIGRFLPLFEDACDYFEAPVSLDVNSMPLMDLRCDDGVFMLCADAVSSILDSVPCAPWSHQHVPSVVPRDMLASDELVDSVFDLADISCLLADIVNICGEVACNNRISLSPETRLKAMEGVETTAAERLA
ncbi:hypothetical protein B5M09_009773 [Aphanomyces astaci]|uniref:Uncharacterized protein n=1 Tax=Aphanomyces astaci TaxID=112090 RepID=A0A425C808_APHAT|nr:hypothetical protein B5M09_009773 [Aphanomyces astaci]